jgi:transcription-repair coupling factor (superfamily II helicase)
MTESGSIPSSDEARLPLAGFLLEEAGPAALAAELRGRDRSLPFVRAGVSPAIRPALVAALLEESTSGPALVVLPDDRSARAFSALLSSYADRIEVKLYPSRGTGYASQVSPPPHLTGMRMDAIDSLERDREEAPVVVASAVALAESVPDATLRPSGFEIEVGSSFDPTVLADDLLGAGYERVDQVVERGQFAVRGGILDLYAATAAHAVRVDFFGDEIESIREFSTFTQRSTGELVRLSIAPAAELDADHRELAAMALAEAEGGEGSAGTLAEVLPVDQFRSPLDLVPAETDIFLIGVEEIGPALIDHWEDAITAMHAEDASHLYVDIREELEGRAILGIARPTDEQAEGTSTLEPIRASLAETPARNPSEAESELAKLTGSGYRVVIAFDTIGEAERTRYAFDRTDVSVGLASGIGTGPGVNLVEARIAEGFIWPRGKLAVYPWRRLVNRRRKADREAPGEVRGRLAFSELRVGDYVVHEDHGVARFAGFETREVAGITRDYLLLEYKGEDRVYAPTDQLGKLSRYAGGLATPNLSALGGKKWHNLKARARRAAAEMAGELVNLYAERRTRTGHAFKEDSEWLATLEAAFPHRETADQIEAIEAVKADMESDRPMDRLICGDVGYGKTEVAIRAAVKAASDGKQVILLAPTTILAQQHLGTFSERLADLPFRVEGISRLTPPAESRKILAAWEEGSVDILIGTHRLLSRDVRASELGLVIVDEEQRFGVKQKELLRQMKLKVDVLSLSATPIPRTLQMSMAGLRDISVIETPPEGRRPVRTYVGPWDEGLVERAIRREVEREGQIFFLHNRVESLDQVAETLRSIVPGLRVTVAHGQMPEGDLEEAMLTFMKGEADVLVATTIIESGIDIPAANTLIVDRADRLGLAQAYQIRGRVGRSREKAFAYLMYPDEEALTKDASSRLATLADHTELGSGFRIAMRDLDIRGAGNLLGDEQSGHVAAVGFELYCQLIDEAVAEMSGRPESESRPEPVRLDVDVDAFLPATWIPYEAAKIDIHRRIASATRPGELKAIEDEAVDRFGPMPPEAANLIALQGARLDLAMVGVEAVRISGGRIILSGVRIDSEASASVTSAVPGAIYDWKANELTLKSDDGPEAALRAVQALAGALKEVGAGMLPDR